MSLSTQHIQRELLKLMRDNTYKPAKQHELAKRLRLHPDEKRSLRTLLRKLENEGTILKNRGNTYCLAGSGDILVGTISVHPHGFAFVKREDSDDDDLEDIFIPPHELNGARHLDRVKIEWVELTGSRRKGSKTTEGRVIDIVERGSTTAVGTLVKRGRSWFIIPDDSRLGKSIHVTGFAEGIKPAKNRKVNAELEEPEKLGGSLYGEVIEDIGGADEAGVDVLSIMRTYKLTQDFPADVIEEAKNMKPGVTEKEVNRRQDFRGWLTYTIDPPDARDHDDALSVDVLDNGNWRLGVHIADVAHYVQLDNPIDREAVNRGISAYLVDRVVTMLPGRLTTDLCSLVPQRDRLVHSVIIEMTREGKIVSQETCEGVIHSKARLTYGMVQDYFDEGIVKGINKKIQASLQELRILARTLRDNRVDDGAVMFSVPEVRCELTKDGKIKDIVKRDPIEAYTLVEECMLVANKVVAEILTKNGMPAIYRIHEEPTEEQWASMAEELVSLGVPNPPMDRAQLNDTLEQQTNPGLKYPTVLAMLKNMQRALYSETRADHFGLSFTHYTHFTSPIRRYPDLMVHRMLKAHEKGNPPPYADKAAVAKIAMHCSEREQNAEKAEKDTTQAKLLEHYEKQLESGEFEPKDAYISSIKPRGILIELQESLMRGLIPFAGMKHDYFAADETGFKATGKRTGKVYRLGDRVKVKITKVDRERKQIELEFV